MWARVSTYQGSADRLDEDTRYVVENILPKVRQMTGYVGVYSIGDRTTGKSMSITLWHDEESLRATEQDADQLRDDSADHAGETIQSVERFEVLFHDHA